MRGALRIAATCVAAALLPGVAAAKPQRILSMNQCADLMVLQLVPKTRVAAVTYLAKDGAQALFPGAADRIPVNYGTPEDIIKFRPDLILAGDFSTAVTRRLAKEVGAPIVEMQSTRSFEDVRRTLRQVGAAVGEPARAEILIREMDARLADLAAHPPTRPVRVVAWEGGATVPGIDTFANRIITAAGAVNIAAQPGRFYRSFDVERLLEADPDALLFGGDGKPLLQNDEARHRVVRRVFAGRRIGYPEVAFSCGLPQSAKAAVDLRRALDALPPRPERRR